MTVRVTQSKLQGPVKGSQKLRDITHNNSRLEPMNALHNIP